MESMASMKNTVITRNRKPMNNREAREERNRKIRDFGISVLILVIGIVAVLAVLQYRRSKILGAVHQEDNQDIAVAEADKTYSTTMEYEGKTYRRNAHVKAILCVGIDRRQEFNVQNPTGFAGQADAMFLIAQDTARNQVKILMIPRDTMTEIMLTDIQGHELGKGVEHLTRSFAFGDGQSRSCEYLVNAVSEFLFDMKIDHYLAMNMSAIAIMNDAVGGVTVTIPLDGMETRDPAFIKGNTVTLHGDQAEKFVRFRDINIDFSAITRMSLQKQYAIQFEKAAQEASRTKPNVVSDMLDQIQPDMLTDMAKAEYLKIALDVMQNQTLLDGDFLQIPGENVTTELYDEFHPDLAGTQKIILDLFYREAD